MRDLLLGLGMVAAIEGLVLVVVPMRLEDMIAALNRLSRDQRRLIGLMLMSAGVMLIWLAKQVF